MAMPEVSGGARSSYLPWLDPGKALQFALTFN